MQLEVSMKQIHEWIHGAEDMLDSGYEGLDYDTLNDTISEHKVKTSIVFVRTVITVCKYTMSLFILGQLFCLENLFCQATANKTVGSNSDPV